MTESEPIMSENHAVSHALAGPVQPYQEGTFFLPPDVSNYNDPFTYFLGITYSADHNQFQLTNSECKSTLKLVPKLKTLYKNAGAHRFHTNYVSTTLQIGPGFYTVPLTTTPLNGTVHLYLTSQSTVNAGTTGAMNLMTCLSTETPYTCFTQSQANQQMLDDMNANTDIKLPEWPCLGSGKLAGIILGSIGGFILLCILYAEFLKWANRCPSEEGYSAV